MGLLDSVVQRVLIEVKGDVSDAKRALKDLQGEEKKLAEQRIAGMEAGNKSLDGWVTKIGQVGIAIGALKVGMDAFEKYAHRLDVESAAAGANVERLSIAAKGLKTNSELLEHAAALRSGTFKLEQGQLETVEKAMFALEERGKSSSEVWSAMEAALTKGSIKPLQSLGVVIDDTGHLFDDNGEKLTTYGKRQEALSLIMKELAKTAKEAEGAQLDQADAMGVQIVRLRNQWEDVQLKLGEIVATIGGPLLSALASSIERTAKLINMLPKGPGGQSLLTFMPGIEGWNQMMSGADDVDKALFGTNHTGSAAVSGFQGAISAYQAEQAARPDYFGAQLAGVQTGVDRGALASWFEKHGFNLTEAEIKKIAEDAATASASGFLRGVKGGGGNNVGVFGQDNTYRNWTGASADSSYHDAYGANVSLDSIIDNVNSEQNTALTSDWFKRLKEQQSKKENFLENTFGKIEDFNLYAQAFQMLGGAVTAGLDAWIDGSVSAGEAIKKFIGTALKGLATHMAIEALKHGAYALSSLAFGDIAGAGTHAAAAAAFTAGSVAAAVAAKEMGGGGASAPKGASGGASAGGGGSGGGGSKGNGKQSSGNVYYIAYGDAFAEDSPRQRRLRAEQTVKQALGGAGGEDS